MNTDEIKATLEGLQSQITNLKNENSELKLQLEQKFEDMKDEEEERHDDDVKHEDESDEGSLGDNDQHDERRCLSDASETPTTLEDDYKSCLS